MYILKDLVINKVIENDDDEEYDDEEHEKVKMVIPKEDLEVRIIETHERPMGEENRYLITGTDDEGDDIEITLWEYPVGAISRKIECDTHEIVDFSFSFELPEEESEYNLEDFPESLEDESEDISKEDSVDEDFPFF